MCEGWQAEWPCWPPAILFREGKGTGLTVYMAHSLKSNLDVWVVPTTHSVDNQHLCYSS